MSDSTKELLREIKLHSIRCPHCKSHFHPSPRLRSRQKTCGSVACKKKNRARYQKRYRYLNPEAEREIRKKIKNNRPKNFWKIYRKNNPIAAARNRARSKLLKILLNSGLQRKLDIVQMADLKGTFVRYERFATSHRWLIDACRYTHAA